MNLSKLAKNNNKAFALLLAIFILVAFSLLGLTALNLLSRQTPQLYNHLNAVKALYLSEAGMNFFREYTLPWDNDFSDFDQFMPDDNGDSIADGLTRTLGQDNDRFTIIYAAGVSPRQATVVVTGSAANATAVEVNRDLSIDFAQDVNQEPYESFDGFNAYFGDPLINIWNNMTVPCSGYTNFRANVYFASTSLNHQFCDVIIPYNLYVAGSYGVSFLGRANNDCYANTINDTSNAGFGIMGIGYCPDSPASNCCGGSGGPDGGCATGTFIPPQKPAIDTIYYETLYQRAVATGATTPTSIRSNVDLAGRNWYFNTNLIIDAGGVKITGPGNIISSGTITINGAGGTLVDERVGLIAERIIIQENALIGGASLDSNGLIDVNPATGDRYNGAIIYARGDNTSGESNYEVDVEGSNDPTIKATILVPNIGSNQNNAVRLGKLCSNPRAQVQGIVYTRSTFKDLGTIYGYLYTDEIIGNMLNGRGDVKKNINYTSGIVDSLNELPLSVKGLYTMTESAPDYD